MYLGSAKTGKQIESTILKLTETLIDRTSPNTTKSTDVSYAEPGDASNPKTLLFYEK